MNTLYIKKYGRLGNNIFQYLLAQKIKSIGPIEIYIDKDFLSGFDIHFSQKTIDSLAIPLKGTQINYPIYEQLLKKNNNVALAIESIFVDMNLYTNEIEEAKNKETFCLRNRFPTVGYNKNYIVISIRLEIPQHINYPVLPLSFYKKIIGSTGLKPVFVGQLNPKLDYTKALKDQFSDAIFIENPNSHDEKFSYEQFEIIRQSKNKILSVSTFSYLAAVFGDKDSIVHMPIYGLFNPIDRPDLNFKINDDRFIYYYNIRDNIKYKANSDFFKWAIEN
jgi:hypothetical protein